MKNKQSIAHFPGREQQIINLIKNRLNVEYHPQIIFFVNSKYVNHIDRSALNIKSKEERWSYSLSLLLVFQENTVPTQEQLQKFQQTLETTITLNLLTCSLPQMQEQLANYSLFFTWIRAKAIVLYKQDGAIEKLQHITFPLKNYQEQMNQWQKQDPTFSTAFTQQLQPLPEKKIEATKQENEKHKEHHLTNDDNQNIVIQNYGTLNLVIKSDELKT